MSNEIVKKNIESSLISNTRTEDDGIAVRSVTASGDATAIGNVFGDVNIEASSELIVKALQTIAGQQDLPQRKSHSVEWVKLDRNRFHVFVLDKEDYSGSTFTINTETALMHTDPQLEDYFSCLTEQLITELLKMPCLFTVKNKSFKTAFQDCPAFLGKLTGIRPQPGKVSFDYVIFETVEQFLQETINENIQDFHLISANFRNQLDEEHWSIRKGDLIQITRDKGIEVK